MTAGLTDESPFGFEGAGQSLPVGDSRAAHVGYHVELPLHSIHQDFQMQLSHARHHRLAGFIVKTHLESGVFLGEFPESIGEPVLVRPGGGFYGYRDHWLREFGWLQNQRPVLGPNGVSGEGILKPNRRANVPGPNLLQLFPMIGVHPQQPSHPLPLALGHVVDQPTGFDCSRVNSEENQPPDKGVGHHLEGQGG